MNNILIAMDTDWSKAWLKGMAPYVDGRYQYLDTVYDLYEAAGLYLTGRVRAEYIGVDVPAKINRITADILYGRQLVEYPQELLLRPWELLYERCGYLLLAIHAKTYVAAIEFVCAPDSPVAKGLLVKTRPK